MAPPPSSHHHASVLPLQHRHTQLPHATAATAKVYPAPTTFFHFVTVCFFARRRRPGPPQQTSRARRQRQHCRHPAAAAAVTLRKSRPTIRIRASVRCVRYGRGRGGTPQPFLNLGFPSTEIKRSKPNFFCSRSLNTVCYFLSFCPLANAVDEPTAGQGQEKKSGGHRVPGAVPNPGRNDDDDDDDNRGARRGQEKF